MKKSVLNHGKRQLSHLYISPLSACNLACKMCYTQKDRKEFITKKQIFNFINDYQKILKTDFKQNLETVTFCGGEVFLQADFIDLINELSAQQIFVQIITNGTIDLLAKIQQPNWVNLIVSIDGVEIYHDLNRGKGNFQKSLNFLKKAQNLAFHFEIFSIVTAENYLAIEKFEQFLLKTFGKVPSITYHPRKPLSYLDKHLRDNQSGEIENFNFINRLQLQTLNKSKNIFPPDILGCYQLALNSDGNVYSCCEGLEPLGSINEPVLDLINRFLARLDNPFNQSCGAQCLGCTEPNFLCGLDEASFLERPNESK